MGLHDDTSIYSRDWGWVNEAAIIDETRSWLDESSSWDNKTIRLEVNGHHVGTIYPKKRRNRTW